MKKILLLMFVLSAMAGNIQAQETKEPTKEEKESIAGTIRQPAV